MLSSRKKMVFYKLLISKDNYLYCSICIAVAIGQKNEWIVELIEGGLRKKT